MLIGIAAGAFVAGKLASGRGKGKGGKEEENARERLESELAEYKAKAEDTVKSVKSLEEELAAEKNKKTALKRETEHLKIQRNELQGLADSLRSENTEIMSRATALMNKYDEQVAATEDLRSKMEGMVSRADLDALREEMEALRSDMTLQLDAVRTRVAAALTQLAKGTLTVEGLRADLEGVGISIGAAEEELAALLHREPQAAAPALLEPGQQAGAAEPLSWNTMSTPERMQLLLKDSFVGRLGMSVNDPSKLARLLMDAADSKAQGEGEGEGASPGKEGPAGEEEPSVPEAAGGHPMARPPGLASPTALKRKISGGAGLALPSTPSAASLVRALSRQAAHDEGAGGKGGGQQAKEASHSTTPADPVTPSRRPLSLVSNTASGNQSLSPVISADGVSFGQRKAQQQGGPKGGSSKKGASAAPAAAKVSVSIKASPRGPGGAGGSAKKAITRSSVEDIEDRLMGPGFGASPGSAVGTRRA